MKTTNANIINFVKGTKSEREFTVLSFSKETGRRVYAYVGNNILDAFCEMTQPLALGLDVILTDKKGYDYMLNREVKNSDNVLSTRVTYKEMLPFSIKFDTFTWTKKLC